MSLKQKIQKMKETVDGLTKGFEKMTALNVLYSKNDILELKNNFDDIEKAIDEATKQIQEEIEIIERTLKSLKPNEILESHENMGYLQGRRDTLKEMLAVLDGEVKP